jgi:hypothetical protein
MTQFATITSNEGRTTAEVTNQRELKVKVGDPKEVGNLSELANANLEGGKRTPSVVLIPNLGSGVTDDNVRAVSLTSSGTGNSFDGVPVPDRFSMSFGGNSSETVGSISYTAGAAGLIYITYLK